MPTTTSLQAKEVMEALSVFKEPVTIDKIVRYMAKTYSQPEEKVKKLVEETLNEVVRYGIVLKHNEFYYRVCDAVDALEESSEEDEDDEVASAQSYESVDSGDIPPEPKSNKTSERKPSGVHAPSRQSLKSKRVNNRDDRRSKKSRDIYSEEEENAGDSAGERRKRSHTCNCDCYSSHGNSSMDDHGYLRARSRSAPRRQ
ncbi:uncharacterized protein LOC118756752 [Rhagoletis pomonella]|uniref:uncharacterized protein LOC118756752 n=1 Tax=Rhagoletis pomonella TaxID=28610 RepID=UPI001781F43A|nr:uncharacterized protein LOC118756752 [Rhagoletis pomonella]